MKFTKKSTLFYFLINISLKNLFEFPEAIIHTHSTYITTLACLKNADRIFEEEFALSDEIIFDKTFGNDSLTGFELGQLLEAENKKIAILANHGVLVVGESLQIAFDTISSLEEAAKKLIEA